MISQEAREQIQDRLRIAERERTNLVINQKVLEAQRESVDSHAAKVSIAQNLTELKRLESAIRILQQELSHE